MSIKWTTVRTKDNYRFEAYCASREPLTVIVREPPQIDHKLEKSLTNVIESVLERLMSGAGRNEQYIKRSKIYQWCEGEGLFQVSFEFECCPHKGLTVYDVTWHKIADDLKAFKVLYGN
jgi:hypothetical protein